jgi:hypothetical protein
VDGIEMFNHFNPQSPLWRELGDPALLRTLPKTYFASVQGAGQGRSFYPAGAYCTLPTLTPDAPEQFAAGTSRTYELYVGDDLRGATPLGARLVLRVKNTAGRAPQVQWDGVVVAITAQGGHTWVGPVDAARVIPGIRRVTITAAEALRLEDLELRVEAR